MIRSTMATWAVALFLGAALAIQCDGAQAGRGGTGCLGPDNTLQFPTTPGEELVLTKPCTVANPGTYKFGEVHILQDGALIFTDTQIDFWASNILIENGGTLSAGKPDQPIGTKGGLVTIHLWGDDQTGIDPAKQGVGVACLSDTVNQCGVPDDIWKSNIDSMGMPVPVAQAKKISSLPSASKYPGVTDDYFYAYMPLPFDGGADAEKRVGYFGYKVLGVSYGGTLQLYGKKGATYAAPECGDPRTATPTTSDTSWARLNADAPVNSNSLTVDRPLSFKENDRIVVTTTDYLPGHSEQLTVAADVTCGTTITVKENLKYFHKGTRFALSSVPLEVKLDPQLRTAGAETRAAVGFLSRSIRIVSAGKTINDDFPPEPPAGSTTPGYFFGGHLVVRQGFKSVQIQGVEFYQMGQGGKLGHYPVHFHHARRTPSGTFVRDSTIDDSMTRWIVVHGTQDLEISRNVGYKSIGHGFYLEDGTEINNTFTANLGVFARAAVDNVQNLRKVPGILAAPDLHTTTGEAVPYRSDYDHPTIFWIMNAWNDFRDNLAVGAGTCGVCYWLLPGVNSGMSRDMKWTSYASMQNGTDRAGMVPLKSFVGNACSTAMTSFQTITATETCQGIGPGGSANPGPLNLPPIKNPLAHASKGDGVADYYPTIGDGGHFSTQCTTEDCSTLPNRCSAGSAGNCMVTILDHYTTSFNWAAFNFAAIWLRPQWYLVTDSVITDSQQAGLTIVTGGGYTDSDVIPGHWALVRKSVFVGNTQDNNPFASNGGPFNPNGLRCAMDANGSRPGNFCLSIDEGVSHQVSNFGMYQRLFSVYDGPAFQDSNAYLKITRRTIDDCKPFTDSVNKAGRCDPPDLSPGKPRQSAWLAGFVSGLPKAGPVGSQYCYMPNAAIGWKQPNGFYYPPAFHSASLYFENVDIRHFVVSPLFLEGTSVTNTDRVAQQYCIWNSQLFTGFAGNDRQTVLNDDDGTLTGYEKTTVINLDDFFAAPVDATQCRSDTSSRTSPYAYVTTVIYPDCVVKGACAKPPVVPPVVPDPNTNSGDWNRACTNENCYGIPLWRQNLMPIADKDPVTGKIVPRSIRMMGQETAQRSSLTVNHGTYYFDTSVSKDTQLACGSNDPGNPCVINVFKPNGTYYLFLIFAKADTEQTYRFYVGDNTDFDPASIHMIQAPIGQNPIVYKDLGALPAGRAHWLNNDPSTANGVVEVNVKLSDLPNATTLFAQGKEEKCQPASYCHWSSSGDPNGKCVDAAGSDAVCRWAVADQDCPKGGCFGIEFTLPSGFATRAANDPRPNPRPPAVCLAKAAPWDVSLDALKVPDDACPQDSDKQPIDFCQ